MTRAPVTAAEIRALLEGAIADPRRDVWINPAKAAEVAAAPSGTAAVILYLGLCLYWAEFGDGAPMEPDARAELLPLREIPERPYPGDVRALLEAPGSDPIRRSREHVASVIAAIA